MKKTVTKRLATVALSCILVAGSMYVVPVASAAGQVFRDDFGAAGSALTGWTTSGGTWSKSGNAAQGQIYGNSSIGKLTRADQGTNFTFEADVIPKSQDAVGYLLFRSNSGYTNYYSVAVNNDTNSIVLYKTTGSTVSSLDSANVSISTDSSYHVKIVASGSSINVYWNNSATASLTAADTAYSSGQFGLGVKNNVNYANGTVQFDNVNVYDDAVVFATNGSAVPAKSVSTAVNVYPSGAGSLQYQWTQSSANPGSSGWTTFSNGATITKNSGDGDWYLHVRYVVSGTTYIAPSSNVFKLDNTKPVITLNGANPLVVALGGTFTDPGATATDNLDGTVAVTVSGSVNTAAAGSYTLTYSATDSAGNSASATRTVQVVDQDAPVITLNGANPLVVALGGTFTDPGATATDNLDGAVAVTVSGSVNTAAVGSYTLTYSATDSAGNSSSATRTVQVADQDAPVITLNGANPLVVALGGTFTDPGATANDNLDGSVAVTVSGSVNTAAAGSYTLTYSATDSAGNSTSATRTVQVADQEAPVITLNGANPLVVALGGTFTDPGATATDNLDGTVAVTVSGSVNTAAAGSYTLTYSATDSADNNASATRTVQVADQDAPVITLNGANPLVVALGGTFTDPGATANDNLDGAVAVTVSGSVNTAAVGSYTLTYSATDSEGNSSSATRTVTVADLTPPVITLIGPDSLTIELGSSYTDAGATAFDNVDGDLGALTPSGSVDTSQVGTYSLVFNVSDAAGNAATAVTRTVHVQDTAVSHSFAPNGDATAHKTASTVATVTGSGISDLGYQWTQSSEEPAGGSWTSFASGETIGQLFGNGNWYLHVKYTKNAQEHQFVSNGFLLDNSKPVIALNGSATVTLNLGETYTEQGATATDNIDTNLTVTPSGSVNTSTAGTYTVSYNVADAAGNAADTVTRTVIVAQAGELATTLNGLASVGAGKPFTVTLGLKNVTDAVYAQDITVSFDPLKVEFESAASAQTGLSLISTTQTAPGQMRFILVSQGAEHAISGTAPVLQLNFKAKSLAEQTTSVIAATTAKVADGTGHEQLAATSSLSVSIQVAIPGDVNQDGTVSIGDLALVAAYYGIDWLNPNWPLVENADSNDNHVIDIADLAAMAQKIVGE
ncbi:immunoglobulin-like domain-containing protein [Paenibacillus cymbidii]|uniref:immunoglobulin-like domain-containing protein n=1 Tax=Paenibacillus cymbidii TaxID=1639034 RepID=UPI0014368134|nr:immunoglobulin-like domain-containing protein [Paenibacillus cymbidii]